MSQPRIDMKVIKRGLAAASDTVHHFELEVGGAITEDLQELIDELDDRDDGADILVVLTKQEADIVLAGLRALQREYEQGRVRMVVSKVAALDAAIEEINAAIRGVVVPA